MPKRSTSTFESEKDGLRDESLGVQHCMACGEVVLILDTDGLAELPRRRTDGAIVLERGVTIFRLNAKSLGPKVIKRAAGYERQHRFGCWNCSVPLGYRADESEDAKLTYLLPDATGQQADLYLALYSVPPCIQPVGNQVRVALDVETGQPKRAVLRVSDSDVGISVVAPAKEGLANAELLEYMGKVLGVARPQLQLSRGWSASSKYLLVTRLEPVDVFKRLKAAVDADVLLPAAMAAAGDGVAARAGQGGPALATGGGASADTAPGGGGGGGGFTAGAGLSAARRHWEENEDFDDLAEAPTTKQQAFIK